MIIGPRPMSYRLRTTTKSAPAISLPWESPYRAATLPVPIMKLRLLLR